MARIVGAIATSHIPAIGRAIERNLQTQPYWKPFFDGYGPVRDWIKEVSPDVAVVVYNDHGLNFFLDKMPTFSVGAAPEYHNADEGWGLSVAAPYPGFPALSWHLIESLIVDGFDITMCQEMLVDHGFTVPMSLLWGSEARDVKTIPICVNTVQFPYPSPARCLRLGRAVARALESSNDDSRVVILGTGGLSHQLEGQRAGFINPDFDRHCMDSIVDAPDALARYSTPDLIRFSGSQGVEFLNWLVMRGAVPGKVVERHRNYHVPISNTAGATMILETRGEAVLASERG
jgi:protocatechuate 4,5-dioxygenase beta chain